MLDFIFQKGAVKSAQRSINKLNPKVNIHVPEDLPLPSIGIIKRHAARVARINGLEEQISSLSDDQLKAKTKEFKERIDEAIRPTVDKFNQIQDDLKKADSLDIRQELGEKLDDQRKQVFKAKQKALDGILEEAFAVVRETAKRLLNMRHYDIQLVGGMVLHEGNIAEMTTGEGKTLVGTSPAYLNALTGDGVHVVTVNDYLAERDRQWMGPIFEFHGLTVGVIQHDMPPQDRQVAYGCDITYGTNNEFGFDYLRDNMVNHKSEMVQRPHHFCIVDEVDSILIDESRTPLIISGPAEESTDKYYTAHKIAKTLKGRRVTEQEEVDAKHQGVDLSEGFDYVADEKAKSISLTEAGEAKAASAFGVDNLHDIDTVEYRHHVLQSLRAKEFFKRDTDYVISEGSVVIVDEFTGRMMPGRRWSDGLHQAVEAKEGIKIERENQTLATITFQNYFRMYQKLSGMTGTANTEATEFKQIYELDCVVMPTNRPLQRLNHPDCIYRTQKEKYDAIVEQIAEVNEKGQPVLVGTISIEHSELLARMLDQKGVKHQVLNAKYHSLEAQIISQAGRKGAVTIATNMAGRGTDIMLGGNAEFMAKALAKEQAKEDDDPENTEQQVAKFLDEFKQQTTKEHEEVVEAGGLFVLGTERHESRRIDNQLRGRSGRQGDPGASRFFVSLEDDLMRLFAGDRIKMIMDRLGLEEGQVIESPMVSRALEVAQKRVENYNFEIRKQLLEYDNVMNKQREVVYDLRRSILEGENNKDFIIMAVEDAAAATITQHMYTDGVLQWDMDGLKVYLDAKFGYDLSPVEERLYELSQEEATEMLTAELLELYEKKEQEIGAEHLRHLESMLLLHTIDHKWKDHLYAMDQLKEGVGLRALGQRDPLVEYKREGFEMFQMMYESINFQVAEFIFKMEYREEAQGPKAVFGRSQQNLVHDEFSGYRNQPPQPQQAQPQPQAMPNQPPPPRPGTPQGKPVTPAGQAKVGRNEPCPCGSGKKYKKCCGA